MTPDTGPAAQLRAAALALQAGDLATAERHLALATAAQPDDPETLRLQAIALDQRGRREAALAAMQRAIAQCPEAALYHNTLATLHGNAGDFDAAVAELERACALEPRLAMAWYNLGVMQAKRMRHADAEAAFRHALDLEPGHAAARTGLGDILRGRGQIDAAAAMYRQVLHARPWDGAAWRGLADLKQRSFATVEVDAMRAALALPQASVDDRIAIGHALAKALDDAGEYAAAFAALAQAKAWSRRQQRWNAPAFSRSITTLLACFTPPPAGAPPHAQGHEVIFIVGMPRSGTTLVEQILATHPRVEGAGELPDLKAVLREESQRRQLPFPAWVASTSAADWQRLGRRYLERTACWRAQRPIATDKLPNNWMYVGAILAMLPGACVVCCRRDPLEGCFACYRQYRNHHDYSDDLSDLAAFWRDYDRAVAQWRTQYPTQVYEHDHAALLADPERGIRALLAACNLPWDARCLRFHASRREVHTPSATQVREPLHADLGRAARYGALLDPLRQALGMPPAATGT